MLANTTSPTLLQDPLNPLAFLPLPLAEEFQVTSYIYVASLGAFLWDWLMSVPDEYMILRKGNITLSKIVYFLSRTFTLGFCVSTTVFQVASVGNCRTLLYIIGVLTLLALMTNSLLFLFRVRAIYNYSRVITAFFGFWWLAILCTSSAVLFGLDGMHIGPTDRCHHKVVHSWVVAMAVCIVTVTVNNTLVFLAISFRIISHSVHEDSWRARTSSFFRGDGVPRVAQNLLRGGQLYYLVTALTGIAQVVLIFGPVYSALLTIPAVALENAMACRVYRAVVLGFINDGTERTTRPFIFTTVVPGTDASDDDMALKDYRLDVTCRL